MINFYVKHKSSSVLQEMIVNEINRRAGQLVICFDRLSVDNIKDSDLILIRHPLNTIISQYYSYGWSHPYPKHKEKIEVFLKQRQNIQKHSLQKYARIVSDHYQLFDFYDTIIEEHEEKIIKYENMMDFPLRHIELLLSSVDRTDLIEEIYRKFSSAFTFTKPDQSERIIKGESKAHRRILDHKEYKKKLNLEDLPQRAIDISNKYDSIPNKYH